MITIFINLTNHPSADWTKKQKDEAKKYGSIMDIPFPAVNPYADEAEIREEADTITNVVLKNNPKAVLCQGEFTMVYAVVNQLLEHNIIALAACSQRKSVETRKSDGTVIRSSEFEFVRFRQYG